MVFGLFYDQTYAEEKREERREKRREERVTPINLDKYMKNDVDNILIKYNLSQKEMYNTYSYTKKKPLIVHCCHHKTGTVVIEKVLRTIADYFDLKYQYCGQSKLQNDTDIWMQHHSKIDLSTIDRPVVGTHMIRNPCSIIVSAYEYHKNTKEGWANRKINTLNKMTYKDILNTLNKEEGLIFEMKNKLYVESSKNTIMDIYNWDYNMPNFLELKYEELMENYDGVIRNMLKHYGFTRDMIKESLRLVRKYNIRNKNDSELDKNKHITNKSINLEKWREYFNNKNIVEKFRKIYPNDLFEKIGYPVVDFNVDSGSNSVNNINIGKKWIRYGGDIPYEI